MRVLHVVGDVQQKTAKSIESRYLPQTTNSYPAQNVMPLKIRVNLFELM